LGTPLSYNFLVCIFYLIKNEENFPHIGILKNIFKAKSNLKNARTKMFDSSLIRLNKSMGEHLRYQKAIMWKLWPPKVGGVLHLKYILTTHLPFLTCALLQHVSNLQFYPSSPIFNYIGGPKLRKHYILTYKPLFWQASNFYFYFSYSWRGNQIGSLPKNWEAPHLINIII
jgi:hypothetical protein